MSSESIATLKPATGATGVDPDGARLLVTPTEAARLLSCSRSRLYTLMAAGELHSLRDGRSRRIPRQALLDYISSLDAR